jgi:hypothetical protein
MPGNREQAAQALSTGLFGPLLPKRHGFGAELNGFGKNSLTTLTDAERLSASHLIEKYKEIPNSPRNGLNSRRFPDSDRGTTELRHAGEGLRTPQVNDSQGRQGGVRPSRLRASESGRKVCFRRSSC